MSEEQIIEKIKELRAIKPSDRYAIASKAMLFASLKARPIKLRRTASNFLFQSLNLGFSIALTALLITVASGNTTNLLKTVLMPNLPGINDENLSMEANNVKKDINIHLEEAEYFAISAVKTTVALKEASLSEASHANPSIIEKENQNFKFDNPTNNKIDNLLKQGSL
jgi:hypothetical protein